MKRLTLPLNMLAVFLAACTLAAAPAGTNYWPLSGSKPPLPWPTVAPEYRAPIDDYNVLEYDWEEPLPPDPNNTNTLPEIVDTNAWLGLYLQGLPCPGNHWWGHLYRADADIPDSPCD